MRSRDKVTTASYRPPGGPTVEQTLHTAQRYEPEPMTGLAGEDSVRMRPDTDGEWVEYSDYATLAARLAKVEPVIQQMRQVAFNPTAELVTVGVVQDWVFRASESPDEEQEANGLVAALLQKKWGVKP